MTSPNSAHTAANFTLAQDGLRDGDVITSPSLTNLVEAVHGNGIIRLQDSAYGMTSRNDTATTGHNTHHAKAHSRGRWGVCHGRGVVPAVAVLVAQAMTIDNAWHVRHRINDRARSGVCGVCRASSGATTPMRVFVSLVGRPVASGNVYPPIPEGYRHQPQHRVGCGQ